MLEPAVALGDLPLSAQIKRSLPALVAQSVEARQPLRLYFQGLPSSGRRRTAEALAGAIGAPLLAADLARALMGTDFERFPALLFREAWFQGAILYLHGLDAL